MKKIKITVSKNGSYTIEAAEGFQGTSCTLKTQDIEQLIGGTLMDSGKKDEYYSGAPDNTVLTDISSLLS